MLSAMPRAARSSRVQTVVGGGDRLGDDALQPAEVGRDGEHGQPVHHGRHGGGGAVQHEADHAAEAGHLRGEMRGLVAAGQARVSSTRRTRG
jgi:hypothetical protein